MSTSTGIRHCRKGSLPLRVRTAISRPSSVPDAIHESTLLSPANAELPPAIPDTARSDGASIQVTTAALPAKASEKYGFVVYVGSLVAWWIYLVWGFVPDRYLKAIGIEWYPHRCAEMYARMPLMADTWCRQWAYLIPCWIMAAVVFVYVGYFALNLYHTPPLDSLTTIVDTQSHLLPTSARDSAGKITSYPPYTVHTVKGRAGEYIPPLYDLPAGMINEALFGKD